MSIGSEAEIGVQFSRWGDMDDKSRAAWYEHMKEHWNSTLMGGYATVCYPPKED